MEDRQFWDLAFMQICSIRFHPRNEVTDLRCEIMAFRRRVYVGAESG